MTIDAVTSSAADHQPSDEESLSALLRTHRKSRLFTQEQLAEAAGLSVRSVRNLETGAVRAPRISSVVRIAAALRLDDGAHRRLIEAAEVQRESEQVRPTVPVSTRPRHARIITLAPGTDLIIVVTVIAPANGR